MYMNNFPKIFALSVLATHMSYSYGGIDTNLHGDDYAAGPFPIGFDFKLYGKQYNQFYTSTNGLVTFDGGNSSYSNGYLPAFDNTLYTYWDDLRTNVSGQVEGTVKYQTIGEAPNRKLIVQWTNQYFYGNNLPMGTFQAVIYEGTNKIKYQYRYLKSGTAGQSATIGIQGVNPQSKIVGVDQSVLHEEQAITFTPNSDLTDYNVNTNDDYDFLDISDLQPLAPVSDTGSFTKDQPSWHWIKIPELNTYQIEIQDLSGNIIEQKIVGNIDKYTLEVPKIEGAKYVAKVRGSINNGQTWEVWSGLSNPVTVDAVNPTINTFQASQINNNRIKWSFSATDNLAQVKNYHLIIANDEAFSDIIANETFDATVRDYYLDNIAFDKPVYGKLEVTDKANNTAISDIKSFKLTPPPVTALALSATEGELPYELTLTNNSTGDYNQVLWDFGDGATSTSTAKEIKHTYTKAGNYTITLKTIGVGGESIQQQLITILPDTTKPVLDNLKTNNIDLNIGTVYNLATKTTLSLNIKDASGIKTDGVSVKLNDQEIPYTLSNNTILIELDPETLENGSYTLTISGTDNYNNTSQINIPIQVALPAPNAPVLTNTVNETNIKDFTIKGSAEKAQQIKALINDQEVGDWVDIVTPQFSLPIQLNEGNNKLEVIAKNKRGISNKSNAINVLLDTQLPAAPNNLSLQKIDTSIVLNWNTQTDTDIVGYNIYRSKQPIESLETATKLNTIPIKANTYKDTPNQDGIYYYRIVSINRLGSQSTLSNQVSNEIDTVGPQAQLSYTTTAKTDPTTGAIGQGILEFTLKTNEALQAAPYLAIVPKGGVPITVELFQQDDTTYTGRVILTAQTLSGPATVLFSGRDKQGNRGTNVTLEKPIIISTQGPNVSQLTTDPSSPINNTTPATIVATFNYDKAPVENPKLSYLLSGANRVKTAITQVEKVTETQYKASFTLPADAGSQSTESLKFYSDAKDNLENVSATIQVPNSFEIYQGNLPALNAPFGLTATAKAGGQVQLTWQPVEGASSYKIYRSSAGAPESVLTAVTTNSYIDTTSDDTYTYTVTAIREKNNQTSESTHSNSASVKTITNAPGAPRNLVLNLTSRGVLAQWQAPLGSTVSSYNLYRGTGSRIDSIAGLKPYLANIKDTQAIDANPSENQSAYVVTAVDAAGNESVISNSVYLNTSLLPVKNVVIQKMEGQQPLLKWEKPSSSIVSYKLAVQTNEGMLDLLESPQTSLSYTDTGYTIGDRLYRITALDNNAMTVDKAVYLPNLTTSLVGENKILKGIMNQITLQVSNQSSKAINQAHTFLDVKLPNGETKKHISPTFSLAPNETKLINLVVGGYDTLPTGQFDAQLGTVVEDDGNTVIIGKTQRLEGSEGAFVASLQTENFIKGGVGKARLTLENTSKVPIELITALNSGTQASNEMRFKLIDQDGNILAVQPVKQVLGSGIVALADGRTVVRIPPGTAFTTSDFEINIPSNTSNQVTLLLEIDKVHYHLGSEDNVSISGKSTSKSVSLVDSAYYGEISSVSPQISYGDDNVIIQGQAKDRETGQLIPNTKLSLILNQDGFERATSIITDETGKFSYTFVPTQTDGGVYKVSLVHPSVNDRPEQQQFTINKLVAGPTPYKLDIPKNYNFAIPVSIKTLSNSQFNDVQVVIKPNLQPTGVIPEGIKVINSQVADIGAKQTRSLPVQFVADNSAQRSGSLILSVISRDTGDKDLAQVRVDYNLSEAKPYLTSSPSMIEAGLAQGDNHVESLTVKNEGLQEAVNLKYQLTNLDGSAVPNWVNIANTPKQTLSIGETQTVDVSFRPPQDLNEGVYQFILNVVGDNVPPQKLNVYASVTRSGKGGVMFKASDIYTGTTDKTGNIIPGLQGATVTLQNEDVPTLAYNQVTDGYGESLFNDIPAGRYVYKVKAANHQELTGRLTVQPGVTKNQPVFVEYNLITVEWNVREVSIQDKYEITLNATFETDVPAAVLVAQPASVNLPLMRTGEVYYGEIVVTNYGLIRADNLKQQLPQSDDKFRFEFGVEVPESLGAKQRITIPYRVVALKSLEDQVNTANTSGAGCYSYGNQTSLTCSYTCANGVRTDNCGTQIHFFSYSNSTCPGTGSISLPWVGGGGGGWGGGTGGFGGGSTSTTVPMKGKKCVFVPRGGGDTTGGCE